MVRPPLPLESGTTQVGLPGLEWSPAVTDKTALIIGVIAVGVLIIHLFPWLLIGYGVAATFVLVEAAGGGG